MEKQQCGIAAPAGTPSTAQQPLSCSLHTATHCRPVPCRRTCTGTTTAAVARKEKPRSDPTQPAGHEAPGLPATPQRGSPSAASLTARHLRTAVPHTGLSRRPLPWYRSATHHRVPVDVDLLLPALVGDAAAAQALAVEALRLQLGRRSVVDIGCGRAHRGVRRPRDGAGSGGGNEPAVIPAAPSRGAPELRWYGREGAPSPGARCQRDPRSRSAGTAPRPPPPPRPARPSPWYSAQPCPRTTSFPGSEAPAARGRTRSSTYLNTPPSSISTSTTRCSSAAAAAIAPAPTVAPPLPGRTAQRGQSASGHAPRLGIGGPAPSGARPAQGRCERCCELWVRGSGQCRSRGCRAAGCALSPAAAAGAPIGRGGTGHGAGRGRALLQVGARCRTLSPLCPPQLPPNPAPAPGPGRPPRPRLTRCHAQDTDTAQRTYAAPLPPGPAGSTWRSPAALCGSRPGGGRRPGNVPRWAPGVCGARGAAVRHVETRGMLLAPRPGTQRLQVRPPRPRLSLLPGERRVPIPPGKHLSTEGPRGCWGPCAAFT